jgi:hypothetical protein
LAGQASARANNELILLQPGESKSFDLTIQVLENESEIKALFPEASQM